MITNQQLPSEEALTQALLRVSEEMIQAWTAEDWEVLKQIEPRARALAEIGFSGGDPSADVLSALRMLEQLYRKIISKSTAERERARKELCSIQGAHAAISSYKATGKMY